MKENKGITLIALLVTIIIMLILIGVSMKIVIDGNLFPSAQNAVDKTNNKVAQQEGIVNELIGIFDEVEESQITEATAGKRANKNLPYYSNGKTAIIPAGFTVSGIPSENSIDGGLVIYLIDDKTDEQIKAIDWTDGTNVANLQKTYDQFVWIPIARENINDMYMCQSEDGTKSCRITVENGKAKCTTHDSNLMAGRLYATGTGETFTYNLTTQTYTANSGLREPDIVTDYDNDTTYLGYLNGIIGTNFYPTTDTTNNTGTANTDLKTYLQEEYNEIVKSVYENQGFYVGRYEASSITTSDGTAIKVVAGATPSNSTNWYYMYAQQKDYATNKGLKGVGSTMIQGAAYDQVMKFVNDTTNYDVTSTGYALHNGSIPWQTAGLNYTDPSKYNDVSKNIYDLEGNVSASTTEANNTCNRVVRGGDYYYSDSASYRCNSLPSSDYSSLSQLYIK